MIKIRETTSEDIEILKKYDRHISKQELENSIRLNRVYIAEEAGVFIG